MKKTSDDSYFVVVAPLTPTHTVIWFWIGTVVAHVCSMAPHIMLGAREAPSTVGMEGSGQ